MLRRNRGTFFERLTGSVDVDDDVLEESSNTPPQQQVQERAHPRAPWNEEDTDEGQLMVDVYQTNDEIFIQAMVAGVPVHNLKVVITREMVTISGRRDAPAGIQETDYFYKELYWGAFSRTIVLPEEIEPDEAEATERHGLLTLRLPKIDKHKKQEVAVKSIN